MFLQGLDGADIILLVVFFYVSYKLYKRAKKEIKIFWNNGEEEIRDDVPFCKTLDNWLDVVEEEEREVNNNDKL